MAKKCFQVHFEGQRGNHVQKNFLVFLEQFGDKDIMISVCCYFMAIEADLSIHFSMETRGVI